MTEDYHMSRPTMEDPDGARAAQQLNVMRARAECDLLAFAITVGTTEKKRLELRMNRTDSQCKLLLATRGEMFYDGRWWLGESMSRNNRRAIQRETILLTELSSGMRLVLPKRTFGRFEPSKARVEVRDERHGGKWNAVGFVNGPDKFFLNAVDHLQIEYRSWMTSRWG